MWQYPLTPLTLCFFFQPPLSYPFEEHRIGGEWEKWYVERMFMSLPRGHAQAKELQTLRLAPEKPGSFSVGDALEELQNAGHNSDN